MCARMRACGYVSEGEMEEGNDRMIYRYRVKEGETEGETEEEFVPASYAFRLLCQSEPRYLEIARN